MFGDKGIELEKWIKSGKWDKIGKKFLHSTQENRLILAKALSCNTADEGYNALVDLIKDEDPNVQIEAVKSLGLTGTDRAVAQLQWVMSKAAKGDTKLIDAVQAAISCVRERHQIA